MTLNVIHVLIIKIFNKTYDILNFKLPASDKEGIIYYTIWISNTITLLMDSYRIQEVQHRMVLMVSFFFIFLRSNLFALLLL